MAIIMALKWDKHASKCILASYLENMQNLRNMHLHCNAYQQHRHHLYLSLKRRNHLQIQLCIQVLQVLHTITTHKERKELILVNNIFLVLVWGNLNLEAWVQLSKYLLYQVGRMHMGGLSIYHRSNILALQGILKLPCLCMFQLVDSQQCNLHILLDCRIPHSNRCSHYFQHNQDLHHKLLIGWFPRHNHLEKLYNDHHNMSILSDSLNNLPKNRTHQWGCNLLLMDHSHKECTNHSLDHKENR